MPRLNAFFIVIGLSMGLIATPTLADSVSYNNTTNYISGGWTPDGFWPFSAYDYQPIGDEITLGDGSQTITEFDFVIKSTQAVTLQNVTLSFYLNDGKDVNHAAGAPGTLRWTVALGAINVDGTRTVVVPVPDVAISKTFTWVVSADGDSDCVGLATADPPSPGSSGPNYWNLDPKGWCNQTFQDYYGDPYDPVANFAAEVIVTPEPTSMLMLCFGAALILKKRLCRRQRVRHVDDV